MKNRFLFALAAVLVIVAGSSQFSFSALTIQQNGGPISDQILVGGNILTDVRNLKILIARATSPSGAGNYGTFRANGATGGYQIPAGKVLQCFGMKINEETGPPTGGYKVVFGTGTNDVGWSSASVPSSANFVMTYTPTVAVGATGFFDETINVTFGPAGNYPFFDVSCGTLCTESAILYCYERNNP